MQLTAAYAPVRNQQPRAEDESAASRELNRALSQNDTSALVRLTGSRSPLQAQWTFVARKVVTGRPVKVQRGSGTTDGGLNAEEQSLRFTNDRVIVHFPRGVNLYELTATASVSDRLGSHRRYRNCAESTSRLRFSYLEDRLKTEHLQLQRFGSSSITCGLAAMIVSSPAVVILLQCLRRSRRGYVELVHPVPAPTQKEGATLILSFRR